MCKILQGIIYRKMQGEQVLTGKFNLDNEQIAGIIDRALREDTGTGDITTNAVIDNHAIAKAVWVSKQKGVVSGLTVAEKVFRRLDRNIEWVPAFKDGDVVGEGDILVNFKGRCRAVLTAERVALNFAQRMSGIATQARKMVKELEGLSTQILDTRKTVPGLRILDKYAVASGGGINHRIGLYDLAMIKDNHIIAAGSISKAVERVRNENSDVKVEVETTGLQQVDEALQAGADIIMLDNMSADLMKQAVQRIGGRAGTEASGNITFDNIRQAAETGVDFISVGALTHSVKAFDISQQIEDIF